jgi:hypothetical protein
MFLSPFVERGAARRGGGGELGAGPGKHASTNGQRRLLLNPSSSSGDYIFDFPCCACRLATSSNCLEIQHSSGAGGASNQNQAMQHAELEDYERTRGSMNQLHPYMHARGAAVLGGFLFSQPPSVESGRSPCMHASSSPSVIGSPVLDERVSRCMNALPLPLGQSWYLPNYSYTLLLFNCIYNSEALDCTTQFIYCLLYLENYSTVSELYMPLARG